MKHRLKIVFIIQSVVNIRVISQYFAKTSFSKKMQFGSGHLFFNTSEYGSGKHNITNRTKTDYQNSWHNNRYNRSLLL